MYYALIEITDEAYKAMVEKGTKVAGTLSMLDARMGQFNAWRRKKRSAHEEKSYKLPHGRVTITEDVTRIRMQFCHNESVTWHDMADEVDLGLEYIWRETKAK